MNYRNSVRIMTSAALLIGVFCVYYWGVRFHLVVAETHIETPTPLLQSGGYDKVVRVVVKPRGYRPSWLPDSFLNILDGTQPQLIKDTGAVSKIRESSASWHHRNEGWELTYTLKLRKVSRDRVILKDRVALSHQIVSGSNGIYSTSTKNDAQLLDIEVVARNDGTTLFTPVRDTKLTVLSVSSGPAPSGTFDHKRPVNAVIQLKLQSTDSNASPLWNLPTFALVDAAGQRLDASTSRRLGKTEIGGAKARAPFCLASLDNLGSEGPKFVTIKVGWAGVKRGPIRVQGRIILNTNWPLGVDITIRDAQNHILTLSPTLSRNSPNIRIAPVAIAPYNK